MKLIKSFHLICFASPFYQTIKPILYDVNGQGDILLLQVRARARACDGVEHVDAHHTKSSTSSGI